MEHISEDWMEAFALGALPQVKVKVMEEHLLVCQRCRDALMDTGDFADAMAEAATLLRQQRMGQRARSASGG